MGYASQVALTLTAEAETALRSSLATESDADVTARLRQRLDTDATRAETRDHTRLYFWNWSKWYAEDPDVAWLEAWLLTRDPEQYGYVRLGENDDDYERHGVCDPFEIHRVHFLDFTLEPDRPSPRSNFQVLTAAARDFVARYHAARRAQRPLEAVGEDLYALVKLVLYALK